MVETGTQNGTDCIGWYEANITVHGATTRMVQFVAATSADPDNLFSRRNESRIPTIVFECEPVTVCVPLILLGREQRP